MSFKVSWKVHIICFLLAYLFCYIQIDNISNVFLDLVFNYRNFQVTAIYFLDMIIVIFALMIPITLVHEIIHGISYSIFGGKVKFGFKGIYAYTQEVSGITFHRTKFLVILLAPVIVISLGSLFISNSIGTIVFILNLLGSIGDILMSLYLCKSSEDSYIIDKSYGFDIVNMSLEKNKVI